MGPGTAPVEIVALGSVQEVKVGGTAQESYVPRDYSEGNFTVQVGAFKDKDNAIRLRNSLTSTYKNAHVAIYESPKGTIYRVQVGSCNRLDKAKEYKEMLEAAGYADAMVVAR